MPATGLHTPRPSDRGEADSAGRAARAFGGGAPNEALHGLLSGAALAVLELGLVLAYARELFLSQAALARYAALALTALPALCAVLAIAFAAALRLLARGTFPGSALHLRRTGVLVFALGAPLFGLTGWLLMSGRRVRAMPGRALWVALFALAASAGLAYAATALLRARSRRGHRPWLAAGLLACAALALALDGLVLRRLYAPLHAALACAAVAFALCAPAFGLAGVDAAKRRLAAFAGLACGFGALLGVYAMAEDPNARFAVREAAPLSGKLLGLVRVPPPAAPARATAAREPVAERPDPVAQHAGIDLRGRDVLLITVDALRADRLRAYGGSGLTPALDALAEHSVVFLRAYTPTPHTSYAIASLFTSKFMQPLLALDAGAHEHVTLTTLLRRHGYHTAAFYPPSVFYVDGERFASMRREHFGFEYVKEVYASGEQRVAQLERYLAKAPSERPLFVWVHLFEPHEPYDPPPAFARGDTPVERYDGEVAAADAAAGELIARFRRVRPGATVVLTADHGEEFGDHGGHHHGTALYDEHVRVPLLWSSPGAVRPRHVQAPVEILDIATTLLAALGIPRDARMRGDDLSPLLAGEAAAPRHAFSSIEGARAFSDGRHKLICREGECRLFDLQADPGERRDVSRELPGLAAGLREALDQFVASLPRHEALARRDEGAFPEALTRARLGDASAGPALVPLLSSARPQVRSAAARALGDLGVASARNVLSRMRADEPDPEVAAEAALAALRLGDADARPQVERLLARGDRLARRAALALAARGVRASEAVLLAAAQDRALPESERIAAIAALAPPCTRATRKALAALLHEPALRVEVARALGRLGDRRAVRPLLETLRSERVPGARSAEARALLALGARRKAVALTRRFLGTRTALPDGVALLRDAGALARPSGAGADLVASPQPRKGEWECAAAGCRPLPGARIRLPSRGAPEGPARVIVRAAVEGVSRLLRFEGERRYLNGGAIELAFEHAAPRGVDFRVEADEGVWLQAIAVVAAAEDVPAAE